MEGKTFLTSLTVAQAIADTPTTENSEEVAKRRVRLGAEAISSFDAHTSDDKGPCTSYDPS